MRQLLLPIGAALSIGNSIRLSLWSRLKRTFREDSKRGGECKTAMLNLTKREIGNPFFRSNQKGAHDEDCQHYSTIKSNESIERLMKSEDEISVKRLKFLIDSGLNASLRLLNKEPKKNNSSSNSKKFQTPNGLSINSNNPSLKENLKRVHITKLIAPDYVFDESQYLIIYGKVKVEILIKEN